MGGRSQNHSHNRNKVHVSEPKNYRQSKRLTLTKTIDMNSHRAKLILASQSPRRRQLLADQGFDFEVVAPDDSVEEAVKTDTTPEQLVRASAYAKAEAIAREIETGMILAADTVAECDAQILGKPVDRNHAEQMLRLMSGKRHRVLTGVCLWHRPSDCHLVKLEETVLRMDALSETLLKSLLDSNGWVGKAGGFGLQDGLDWLHVETGLESNVVGLPVERLNVWIDELIAEVG